MRRYHPQAFQRVSCNIPSRSVLCDYWGAIMLMSSGRRNLDASIFKTFSITERMKTQFRTELFNAFNTPYSGQPMNIGFVSNRSMAPEARQAGQITNLRWSLRIIQFGLKSSM